ncbi:MAG: hypothetical protein V1876_00970 [Candidatus Peregrinibacteria bacterium]
MGKLTADDVLRLIETHSLSPLVPAAGGNGKPPAHDQGEEREVTALRRMLADRSISLEWVDDFQETSHIAVAEAARRVLSDIPRNQPLDEIELSRVRNAVDGIRAMVKANPGVFARINPKHSPAILQIATAVTRRINRAIAGAAQGQPPREGTAS